MNLKDKLAAQSPAIKISIISIVVNLLLSLIKLLAGLFGHSQALVADSVHSASDVLTTVFVIISLRISSKTADADHEYGHQKYESIATLILALVLADVGIKLGVQGVKAIIGSTYKLLATPSTFTMAAATLSILVKELMYHVTLRVAKKENSNALKADAWHHRSDALSSIGSLAGIAFAIFGFPIMDSVASLVICCFILKTSVEIIIEAIKGLTDSACDKETEQALYDTILSVSGVLGVDSLKTRIFGTGFYVDVEIQADSNLSFAQAHDIAEKVHDEIEAKFPDVLHCMVHANPKE